MLIIISHITTELNYRTAVQVRSDFLAYNNFPEVYHGHKIITLPFSVPARRVTGQGWHTTYSVLIS